MRCVRSMRAALLVADVAHAQELEQISHTSSFRPSSTGSTVNWNIVSVSVVLDDASMDKARLRFLLDKYTLKGSRRTYIASLHEHDQYRVSIVVATG